MLTLRTGLFGASGATLILAGLRLLLDGPDVETITALTLIAGCVLFVGAALVMRKDRQIALQIEANMLQAETNAKLDRLIASQRKKD